MPVRIYDISLHDDAKPSVEAYVFRHKREEVRLDAHDEQGPLTFSVEYIPQAYSRQTNFVAYSVPLRLDGKFEDTTKAGCQRYLRHVARAALILKGGSAMFTRLFPMSQIPLEELVDTLAHEIVRYT